MRDGNSFPLVCVCVSGNFGVRSIVLCKCSGKYIDIYFSLKITFQLPLLYWFACPLARDDRITPWVAVV